ncbi:MAG: DUF2142 domain-containing protein [Anaerolineaceae bacterium]|nr:DUF2142 domain-containing protein [Anaerolineaceae bacterium]
MVAFLRRKAKALATRPLLVLLLVAFIFGVIFIFVIPPWEHYDEPGHFEYAWLIANRSGWPQEGDYDQTMRREAGASMLEHNFHEYSIYELLFTDQPISITIAQTGDVPLYYFLVSIPLRLIKYSDITFQLYVARFVSLGLFLVTITLAYKITTLIFRKGHPLTWLIPLFLIFLPGLLDIMTAVNNDAAAITSFTFFIYISLLLLVKGPSLKRFILLLAAVAFCLLSKSTSILAAPLSILVILLTVIKKRSIFRVLLCGLGVVLAALIVLLSLDAATPAYTYADNATYLPTRETQEQAPLGNAVIVQEPGMERWHYSNIPISTREISTSQNSALTLGAWIWADSPTTIQYPKIRCMGTDTQTYFTSEPVAITNTPTYYAFSASAIDNLTSFCWLAFYGNTDSDTPIYWDGILLTEGQFSSATPPSFINTQGEAAIWDGKTVTNLVKNGSGESAWPIIFDLSQKLAAGRININISSLFSIFDLDHFSWYYQSALAHLFRSFWGVFGWGQINFTGAHPYRYFIIFSFLGGLGALLSLRRKLTPAQISIAFFFICVIALQLTMVLFRGVGSWFTHLFLPHSRYIFPAVFPVSFILISGYYEIITWVSKILRINRAILFSIFVCVLITPTIWAILSFAQF